MLQFMIIGAVILLLAVASSKVFYRFGVPSLLLFLVLGMVFGSDGIFGIGFDNFEAASKICSIGLIFIMFFGGFGTNWKIAKPVATKAVLLSTLGVGLTALLTGLFCQLVLKTSLLEGFLIGSVLASTDAASVFSILRSRNLNLKDGLASLLEIESGSNDPFSYMLTVIVISIMTGNNQQPVLLLLGKQVIFAIVIGVILALLAASVLRFINLEIEGLYPILVTAVVVLGYALSEWVGGNGYLCVYIIGIILGNSKILHKRSLVHFFDGVSWLMQILLFFTLGLLSFPSQLHNVLVPGVLISVFLIVAARPIATFAILTPFKVPFKSQLLVSWVGLRGAASIVFAIFAVNSGALVNNDIFHIVFLVALLSVGLQGSLIPLIAKKLDLVEPDISVFKTFNDYQDESLTKLVEVEIAPNSPWAGKNVMDANIPEEILVVMVKRGNKMLVPKGSTMIKVGDVMVLSGNSFDNIPM
ncbi:potassium/proton antiporter [Hydrogenoanaerobacterium sp.]|uniref:potassium/proton antiporter n=1 Tax=Hydrogenoanaerobacterium sp. TaxID=2953763 RepID=UPI0028983B76|nr:potassium/proton antiporter [Hydrogenoanaerobacterium sp.]